jgi:hypothetical protein
MKLKITSALLALTGMGFGATITLSSVGVAYDGSDDYGILLSTGSPVAPEAGIARVGIFTTLTDAQVSALALAQDYTTLFAGSNFTTIVSDNFTGIATAYGLNPGFVSASITGYAVANPNESLYVYITSGTELGLFRSSLALTADPVTPPENSYAIGFGSGVNVIGAAGPDYSVPYTGIGTGPVAVNSFQLVNAVPEPSAALLGALGALGLLRRRRN